jgi:hypothetical protein
MRSVASKLGCTVETPLPSPITEFALQITSNLDGRDHYACGTAVPIAPHLALSALHVFEDHWTRHESGPMPMNGEATGRFAFVLAQAVGNQLNLWSVTRLWATELSDIVLMRLSPASENAQKHKFRHLSLDLAAPRVGERVQGFGYADSIAIIEGPKSLRLKQRSMTTHGTVVEVFHQQRDPIKMPFPCFRTNARFDGGMSGGPIFNRTGSLCGLICSTYPPFSDDEDHASYAASLWPAMATPIDLNRRGHPSGVWYRTFDLIEQRILLAKNADLLVVDSLDDSPNGQPHPPRIGFHVDLYDERTGTIQGQSGTPPAIADSEGSQNLE